MAQAAVPTSCLSTLSFGSRLCNPTNTNEAYDQRSTLRIDVILLKVSMIQRGEQEINRGACDLCSPPFLHRVLSRQSNQQIVQSQTTRFNPLNTLIPNKYPTTIMSQGFPVNVGPVDAPKGTHDPTAAESWLEPLLLKSNFYRKHFTRDGRRESKSTIRRQSIDAEIRKNSVVSQPAEDEAPEPRASGGA